jgi:hypothetical protein
MKKLAVLTAVVLLFGVAGFAAASQSDQGGRGDQNQDPAIQANNNDLVGAKGEQAAAANDQSIAVNVDKTVNVNKSVDVTKIDKSTEVKAEEGGQAANNGGSNVNQEALLINNELPGSHPTTTTTTTTSTSTSKNTGNNAIGADSANAKNYSDNPEAKDGSQLLQGGGSQTMNKADDGGIVATGAGSVTKNEASDGGMINTSSGNLNKVTNEGKYAAQNATQNVTETNVKADGFGNIAAYGNVLTLEANNGGIAAAPGSAVSKIDLQGSVEHNDIRFDGNATSVTKSGEAKSVAVNNGEAKSDEAKTGDAFSISSSKSKSGFAAAVSLGKSKSGGGNGAAALGGASSESEASATSSPVPYLDGGIGLTSQSQDHRQGQSQDPSSVEATSGESNALSANGAIAKSGDSKNVSEADATSGNSSSKSEAEAKSGSAYSTAANFGKATSGTATSGNATGAAASMVNRFTTGTNNLAFGGSFNGVGTFNANSGVNALNQSPISINAVVGGNVAGK